MIESIILISLIEAQFDIIISRLTSNEELIKNERLSCLYKNTKDTIKCQIIYH